MGKTAIVIGATGLVGKALVRRLATASHIGRVIAVTRRPVEYESPKIENRVVDFDHLSNHAEVFRGDYLFSCLGTTLKQAGSQEAQRRVDLEYQLAAAELAAKNGVPHYLLVSSSFANAASSNFYLRLKGELEERVLKLPFKRISIFQPSLLLGHREKARPGEGLAGILFPILTKAPLLRKYRPIRGDEVAAKLVEVSQSENAAHEYFRLDEIFPRKNLI